MSLLTVSSIDALTPSARIATNVTSARPDHQRGGRDGRAARVAQRVLAREAPGHAAQPLERVADRAAIGGTSRGLSSATAMNTRIAPMPSRPSA